MCHLQKLDCWLCKLRIQHNSGSDPNKYILQPCDSLQQKIGIWKEKAQQNKFNYEQRWHCPELQWPPDKNAPTRWVCEDCLYSAYLEFQYNVKGFEAKEAFKKRAYGRHVRSPSHTSGDDEDETTSNPFQPTLKRFLPDRVRNIFPNRMQDEILAIFDENHDFSDSRFAGPLQTERDSYWAQRASDAEHRVLTIFVPLCKVCNIPIVMRTKTADENDLLIDDVYLADVECLAHPLIWKWLFARTQQGPFEVRIQTAKLVKSCQLCIENEYHLRREVCKFLKKHDDQNWIKWMVFSWLLSRGIGNIPFFNHAALNVGFPNTQPPTLNEMLCLMAEGWKRVSWVSWAEVGELGPAVDVTVPDTMREHSLSHLLPVIIDEIPMTSLTQWPGYRAGIPLELRCNLPCLSWQVAPPGEDDLNEEVLIRGDRHRAMSKPEDPVSQESLRLLAQLGRNPLVLTALTRQSGLSVDDMSKALRAVASVLKDDRESSISGTIQRHHGPVELVIRGQNKRPNSLIVTFKGVTMNLDSVKSPRQAVDSDSGAQVVSSTSKGAERDRIKNRVQGFIADESLEDGKENNSNKHVQSDPNQDEIEVSDNALSDSRMDQSNFAESGAVANSEDPKLPELEDGETYIGECDFKHHHLLETGLLGTAPGELFTLPLGVAFNPPIFPKWPETLDLPLESEFPEEDPELPMTSELPGSPKAPNFIPPETIDATLEPPTLTTFKDSDASEIASDTSNNMLARRLIRRRGSTCKAAGSVNDTGADLMPSIPEDGDKKFGPNLEPYIVPRPDLPDLTVMPSRKKGSAPKRAKPKKRKAESDDDDFNPAPRTRGKNKRQGK